MSNRLDIMETKQKMRENANINIKREKVDVNKFSVKEKNSQDNCMTHMKGTIDYLYAQKTDKYARQNRLVQKSSSFCGQCSMELTMS